MTLPNNSQSITSAWERTASDENAPDHSKSPQPRPSDADKDRNREQGDGDQQDERAVRERDQRKKTK